MGGESFSAAQRTAWDQVTRLADDFKSADKVLISTPMWNFGVPYRLKQYFDVITQPGLTFGFEASSSIAIPNTLHGPEAAQASREAATAEAESLAQRF